MRKTLVILFVLLLSCTMMAQQRTGNIMGKVVDTDNTPLPGVTVTLTGALTAPMTSITSAEGVFRFISLPPARDYTVKAELEGFKAAIQENVIVVVGANVELTMVMEMGAIEEEVTVTAVTPVVDSKKTSVGTNVTQEILQELPTARDPWVILQMAPSVIVDRENVGGAESGQQSNYVARGAGDYDNNVWAMDGIVITDPAAIGASPSYYDFDAFEEMQITVGGADVTVQTGGIAMNMVTRRGGNKVTLGGRFYMTDSKFQADHVDAVEEYELDGVNKVNNNKDYGFNIGIPLVKDRAWFWGSFGVQDIKTTTVYGTKDDTLMTNMAAKLNIQIIPENRFEAFIHVGKKEKFGRSASASLPDGYKQGGRYHFGSPILKFQDEHMFGDNLFLSIKYAFSDAGFNLTPMFNLDFDKRPEFDITNDIWSGSQYRYYVERPVNQYNFLANYFNDNLLGVSHDIKVGFELADRNAYTESVYCGNMRYYFNYDTTTVDSDGDGNRDTLMNDVLSQYRIDRGVYRDYGVGAWAAYLSDTITFGRFNLLLGVRYDQQMPRLNPVDILAVDRDNPAWTDNFSAVAIDAIDSLMPAVSMQEADMYDANGDKWGWKVFSPRIGLTWDATGDGKTIAKLSFATYGDFMGTGNYGQLPGGTSGRLYFWWLDNNGNGITDVNELYWHDRYHGDYTMFPVFDGSGNLLPGVLDKGYWYGYRSFDPTDPSTLVDPYDTIDPSFGSTRTTEVMFTLEREIFTDFAVQINATYRRYTQFNWSLDYYPDTDETASQNMYESAGLPPANVPGMGSTKDAASHEWYNLKAGYGATSYDVLAEIPDRYRDYIGIDLVFNKRLSNKWMLNGNFTWQTQATHYGDNGYLDETNLWAYEGKPYSAFIGGASGKINQYVFPRWMFKVSGLYQLPLDINVSGVFMVREGWIIRESFRLTDYTLPNPNENSKQLDMTEFGSERLPVFYRFDMRLEKMIRLGDTGRIYLMADLFNIFNSAIINRRYQMYHGEYEVFADPSLNSFAADPDDFDVNEILNPRLLRLGVRFQF